MLIPTFRVTIYLRTSAVPRIYPQSPKFKRLRTNSVLVHPFGPTYFVLSNECAFTYRTIIRIISSRIHIPETPRIRHRLFSNSQRGMSQVSSAFSRVIEYRANCPIRVAFPTPLKLEFGQMHQIELRFLDCIRHSVPVHIATLLPRHIPCSSSSVFPQRPPT